MAVAVMRDRVDSAFTKEEDKTSLFIRFSES